MQKRALHLICILANQNDCGKEALIKAGFVKTIGDVIRHYAATCVVKGAMLGMCGVALRNMTKSQLSEHAATRIHNDGAHESLMHVLTTCTDAPSFQEDAACMLGYVFPHLHRVRGSLGVECADP